MHRITSLSKFTYNNKSPILMHSYCHQHWRYGQYNAISNGRMKEGFLFSFFKICFHTAISTSGQDAELPMAMAVWLLSQILLTSIFNGVPHKLAFNGVPHKQAFVMQDCAHINIQWRPHKHLFACRQRCPVLTSNRHCKKKTQKSAFPS